METIKEEGNDSFIKESLEVEDMTLLAMKFRKVESKKNPLDLVSNPRVNLVSGSRNWKKSKGMKEKKAQAMSAYMNDDLTTPQ